MVQYAVVATYQSLTKYGRDLTQLARQGKVDPVIGRDAEIRRVIQVLNRRTKNNPVLIGEAGVGKTAPRPGRRIAPTPPLPRTIHRGGKKGGRPRWRGPSSSPPVICTRGD